MILAPRSTALHTSIYQRSKGFYMFIQIIGLLNGRPAGNSQRETFESLSLLCVTNRLNALFTLENQLGESFYDDLQCRNYLKIGLKTEILPEKQNTILYYYLTVQCFLQQNHLIAGSHFRDYRYSIKCINIRIHLFLFIPVLW